MLIIVLFLVAANISVIAQTSAITAVQGFLQSDEAAYLASWSTITQDSYTEPLPEDFDLTCIANASSYTDAYNIENVTLVGNFNSSTFQNLCGFNSLCILASGSTLTMDGNLNVAALIIHGTLTWTDFTQKLSQQWLCAGILVVEKQGSFIMNLASIDHKAYIYLKDNGAAHQSALQTRVFGGYSRAANSFPTIDVSGRPLARTWSLLAVPTTVGMSSITLLHDPEAMGWRIGDRISIAPTVPRSQGTAQSFYIMSMNSTTNQVMLSSSTSQSFDAEIAASGESNVALMSAEVINLSR